jgi:uncharacterized repeat protein (TIGR01451 family)
MIVKRFSLFLSLGALVFAATCFPTASSLAQQTGNVQVSVQQQQLSNGQVYYQYSVKNGSTKPITQVAIGWDYYHSVSQLTLPPNGWTENLGLATGSVYAPGGWVPALVTTEERPTFRLSWTRDGGSDLQPGSTTSGFSVIVPQASTPYLTSNWTVVFADSTAASGVLIQGSQPTITGRIATATHGGGQLNLEIELANAGGANATNVVISQILPRTLAGSGTATLVSPAVPVALGNLAPGATARINIVLAVPPTVKQLSIVESGSFGASSRFSIAQSEFTRF